MLSETIPLLRLSQGHLNLLEACPRKFQHTYLEKLNTPLDPKHEEHQILGSQFHLLMQQREMGLPIGSFLEADTQLKSWMSGFTNAAPEILTPTDSQTFRESEHYRILQTQDYLLTVVYDLFIADSQKAQILDWKTYPKPPNQRKLEQNWQTRLYLYVLAETSDYLPKDISMTYWFVQSESQPQKITFNYNSTKHQQTAKKLSQLLHKLTNCLEDYQRNQLFPQVPENSQDCNYCYFATRCDRRSPTFGDRQQASAENQQKFLPNLADIQEVSL